MDKRDSSMFYERGFEIMIMVYADDDMSRRRIPGQMSIPDFLFHKSCKSGVLQKELCNVWKLKSTSSLKRVVLEEIKVLNNMVLGDDVITRDILDANGAWGGRINGVNNGNGF